MTRIPCPAIKLGYCPENYKSSLIELGGGNIIKYQYKYVCLALRKRKKSEKKCVYLITLNKIKGIEKKLKGLSKLLADKKK